MTRSLSFPWRSMLRRKFLTILTGAAACIAAGWASLPASANQQDFATWLAVLRDEALGTGISPRTLDEALSNVQLIGRVLELDRRQPEFTLTFRDYLNRVVNDARVEKGRRLLDENRALLERIGREYGVQPRFIVALWGIESDFGRLTGGYPVIDALATLAYDGRRSAFFRKELINALKILDGGHIAATQMMGSWAGAMGQSQFMPSSFLSFAVDYDGDGRRDIWYTLPDVFASIANYLSRSGWNRDQTWGRAVSLPPNFDAGLTDLSVTKPLGGWNTAGVRRPDGGKLPDRDITASVIRPGGGEDAFLVYDNYRVIMKWNRSQFFATAVGTLADRIADGG